MASNAISFQGAKLYIAGSSGSAEPITAVTVGYPTILTITGHAGVVNGDVVALAGFTGTDAATLNGKSAVVHHYATGATNDSFAIDIYSTGKTITVGAGTATPAAWTQVKDIKSVKFSPGGRTEIDVTNLDSVAKEKRLGLKDNGTMSGDMNVDLTDAGQDACRASEGSDNVKSFKVELPSSAGTATFDGQVKKMDWGGAVDAAFTGSYEITVTGEITWA